MTVVTRGYSNARHGVNAEEYLLTPANVGRHGIRKLATVAIPGDRRGAEAQPLVVHDVHLTGGGVRDLLIIATLANDVIAVDAETGQLIWTCKLGRPVDPDPDIDAHRIQDHWGILSTPVIDLSSMTLYACVWSSVDGAVARARHYLEAVSLASGKRAREPLDLEGATYDPGGVPPQKFASAARKQRASLLLTGGTIFICFGSIWERAASNRGWVLAVEPRIWRSPAAWCTAVRGSGGGIWMAGAGPAVDKDGNIYVVTGNGDFDGELDWGESCVKLRYVPPGPAGLIGKLEVVDHWTRFLDSERTTARSRVVELDVEPDAGMPSNKRPAAVSDPSRMAGDGTIALNDGEVADMDEGAGGPVVIDDLGIVLYAGKDGVLVVARRDAMGGTTRAMLMTADGMEANYGALACAPLWFSFYTPANPAPTDIRDLNRLWYGRTHHHHGSPIAWESPDGWRLLCWGENSTLRMWSIDPAGVAVADDLKANVDIAAAAKNAPLVKVSFLAAGQEYASPAADVPPGGMPGGMMCLTCNPQGGEAILWATVPYADANRVISPGRLLAYDLTQFEEGPQGAVISVLWDSQDWGWAYAAPPLNFVKFTPPVVDRGRIYLPSYNGVIFICGLA